MKISVLFSIAAATFAFVSQAEAQLQFPPSLNECLATAVDQPSVDLCNALDSCSTNSSGSEQNLQNCIANAQSSYAAATAPAGQPAPAEGILNSADSDYYDIDGHKGWENADQP